MNSQIISILSRQRECTWLLVRLAYNHTFHYHESSKMENWIAFSPRREKLWNQCRLDYFMSGVANHYHIKSSHTSLSYELYSHSRAPVNFPAECTRASTSIPLYLCTWKLNNYPEIILTRRRLSSLFNGQCHWVVLIQMSISKLFSMTTTRLTLSHSWTRKTLQSSHSVSFWLSPVVLILPFAIVEVTRLVRRQRWASQSIRMWFWNGLWIVKYIEKFQGKAWWSFFLYFQFQCRILERIRVNSLR